MENDLMISLNGGLYEFDSLNSELLGELDPTLNEVTLFTGEWINDKKLYFNDIVYMDWNVGAGEYVLISTSDDLVHVMSNLSFLDDVFIAGNIYQNKGLLEEEK